MKVWCARKMCSDKESTLEFFIIFSRIEWRSIWKRRKKKTFVSLSWKLDSFFKERGGGEDVSDKQKVIRFQATEAIKKRLAADKKSLHLVAEEEVAYKLLFRFWFLWLTEGFTKRCSRRMPTLGDASDIDWIFLSPRRKRARIINYLLLLILIAILEYFIFRRATKLPWILNQVHA